MEMMDGLMIVLVLFIIGLLFDKEYVPVEHRLHSQP